MERNKSPEHRPPLRRRVKWLFIALAIKPFFFHHSIRQVYAIIAELDRPAGVAPPDTIFFKGGDKDD